MPDDQTPEVHVDQVASAGDGAAVVEVREPGEFVQGHLRGAGFDARSVAGTQAWIRSGRPVEKGTR